MNQDNKVIATAKFDQWLACCLEMSHEELIKDSSSIYKDLYEFCIAAYTPKKTKAWAIQNDACKIEAFQLDENFNVNPTQIGKSLIRVATECHRRKFYIPIDSYKTWELRDSLKHKAGNEYESEISMFRCMEKKHLILHAYELMQLKCVLDEICNQLIRLPLSREALINMHYCHNLLGTVFEDSTQMTLEQLLEPAQSMSNILSCFPDIKPDGPCNPWEAFRQKVDENYDRQIEKWLKMTPGEFRDHAQWVTCVMDAHRCIMDDKCKGQWLSAIIRLKDPLTAVSKHWYTMKKCNPNINYIKFEDCIIKLENDQDENPQNYEMDNRFDIPTLKTETVIDDCSIKFDMA